MSRFYSSYIVSILGVILAYYIGGLSLAYICILLAILEVSLSFDNAVVNAKVLQGMSKIWQDRFIYFGIPIAVFGMRFVFPVLIVSLATGLGLYETFNLALHNPEKYKEVLEHSKEIIYAFGGSFLLMVFLDFFFEEKEYKWIKPLEDSKFVAKISNIKYISLIVSLIVCGIIYLLTNSQDILFAYLGAMLLHFAISSLDIFFSTSTVRSGFMGFLYLEVLDASFSFDGVIGAFALSSNIFIIMIGLGIGAMFVRSLTLYLVDKKSLQKYVYLEHGAHYAIFMLAIIMLYELFFEVSEVITGTIGIGFILLSFYSSTRYNKQNNIK